MESNTCGTRTSAGGGHSSLALWQEDKSVAERAVDQVEQWLAGAVAVQVFCEKLAAGSIVSAKHG